MSIEHSMRQFPIVRKSFGTGNGRPEAEDGSSSSLSFVFEANGCPVDRALIAAGVVPRCSCGFTLRIVE